MKEETKFLICKIILITFGFIALVLLAYTAVRPFDELTYHTDSFTSFCSTHNMNTTIYMNNRHFCYNESGTYEAIQNNYENWSFLK